MSEAQPSRRQARVLKAWTRLHRWAYRRTDGKVLSRMRGKPTLLLTTTGRRTGRLHTVPLPYLADGGTMIVIGSASGAEPIANVYPLAQVREAYAELERRHTHGTDAAAGG